jgi:hypothetical protein
MHILLFALMQAKQINATQPVCTTVCSYTDQNVLPGPHRYYVTANNANGESAPSNSVDVVVPSGTHNVLLTWDAVNGVTYKVYRVSAPSNVGISVE